MDSVVPKKRSRKTRKPAASEPVETPYEASEAEDVEFRSALYKVGASLDTAVQASLVRQRCGYRPPAVWLEYITRLEDANKWLSRQVQTHAKVVDFAAAKARLTAKKVN